MLNDDDCIAILRQPVQHLHQSVHIIEMKPCRRLIENINRLPGRTSRKLGCELDTLRFTAR